MDSPTATRSSATTAVHTAQPFPGGMIGGGGPLVLIAGPCVIEGRAMLESVAEALLEVTTRLEMPFVFKSSFDKANRTSADSRRGPGLQEGLRELAHIKETYGLPILTDVHETGQVDAVAQVADVLQVPAFLCRQTDLVQACARTGKWVNVKKGQFLAPEDCAHIRDKITAAGSNQYLFTERGVSFGYHNLVFDPRSPVIMRDLGIPVVFDVTHSTQLPAGQGASSGGDRRFAPVLARSAVVNGLEGLFMEVHPDPPRAWSDAGTQLALTDAPALIEELHLLDRFVKQGVPAP